MNAKDKNCIHLFCFHAVYFLFHGLQSKDDPNKDVKFAINRQSAVWLLLWLPGGGRAQAEARQGEGAPVRGQQQLQRGQRQPQQRAQQRRRRGLGRRGHGRGREGRDQQQLRGHGGVRFRASNEGPHEGY